MTQLLWVVGYKLAKHEEGLRWARLAKSAERRVKAGEDQKALRLGYTGVVFIAQGEYEKALQAFHEALAINEKALGLAPSRDQRVQGNGLRQQSEKKNTGQHPHTLKVITVKALRIEHLRMAQLLSYIGAVFLQQGEYNKSLDYSRRALEIWEKALGSEHPTVAYGLHNLGSALLQQGEYRKALAYFPRALKILKEALGPKHPSVATLQSNLGILFEHQGEYEKALKYHRKALAIREKVLGPEHPHVATVLDNMGIVYKKRREYRQALAYFRRTLAIRKKALGPEHPRVASTLSCIGTVYVEQARYQEARDLLGKALGICEKKTCDLGPHGQALFGLAQSLVETDGDKERAIAFARQARDIYNKSPKQFAREIKEVNTWLQKHEENELVKKTDI